MDNQTESNKENDEHEFDDDTEEKAEELEDEDNEIRKALNRIIFLMPFYPLCLIHGIVVFFQ